MSNADIRTMKDNEALLIYGNKLPLKIAIKLYYKDLILNSYTKIAPVEKKSLNESIEIEYIDLDVGVE